MRPFVPKKTRQFSLKHRRPWLSIAVAGCSFAGIAVAQEAAGGAAAGGTEAGATGAGTTPATDKPTTTPGTAPGTAPDAAPEGTGTTEKPSNPFGLPDLPSERPERGSLLLPGSSGASTTFGSGLLQRRPDESAVTAPGAAATQRGEVIPRAEAPSFTAPGGYGGTSQIIDTGRGRFTRPRYRYGASISMGFDDNVFQTSDSGIGVPEQEFRQVIPAQPEISQTVTEREFVGLRNNGGGGFVPVFRTVNRRVILRPATPEQEIVQVIPGIEAQEPTASVVSGFNGTFDAQWATARSVFTFDLRAGVDYYWNRDQDPADYNGSMSLLYVRKFGRRIQFSASANAAYTSQPDFSSVNASQSAQGTYFSGTSKFDLLYRWNARFSTNTSLGLSTINYVDAAREGGSNWTATIGNEFRYLWSPRLTSVLEGRYQATRYYTAEAGNSDTIFLLLGADWQLSRRLRGSFRLGEAIRTFEQSGITKATPYVEASAVYQPTRRSQFNTSLRYGFENTSSAEQETIVLRGSLGYSYAFNPRLNSQVSLNYINNQVTSEAPGVGSTESTSTIIDGTLNLSYLFTRRFSMSARYSYTLSDGDFFTQQYDRSRFFITGDYNF